MGRIRLLGLLPPLLFMVLAWAFYLGMQRQDPNELPSALVGQPAPELTGAPLSPFPAFEQAELTQGGAKLVNFWASWCAPCRVEHPNLSALAAEGLPIYGINKADTPEKARAFLAELGNPYTALLQDPESRTGIDWGSYGVPETFVLDGEGRILARIVGPVTQRVITDTLRPALAKAAAGGTGS